MNWTEIKTLEERRARIGEQMKSIVEKSSNGELTSEDRSSFDAMEADFQSLQKQINFAKNELETEDIQVEERAEQRSTFEAYLRGEERAALKTTDVETGGVVGDSEFSKSFERIVKDTLPFVSAGAKVIITKNANPFYVPVKNVSDAGQAYAEGGTRSTENAPNISVVSLGGYTYDSDNMPLSGELVRNADFDLQGWVVENGTEAVALAISSDMTDGDGTYITGIDGQASAGVSVVADPTDAQIRTAVFGLAESLGGQYRKNAKIMLHSSILGVLRALDTTGNSEPVYNWHTGQVMGFDVVLNDDMTSDFETGGDLLAAVGDFTKIWLRMTKPIVEVYQDKSVRGYTYAVMSQADAVLTDASAIKLLSTGS